MSEEYTQPTLFFSDEQSQGLIDVLANTIVGSNLNDQTSRDLLRVVTADMEDYEVDEFTRLATERIASIRNMGMYNVDSSEQTVI